MADELENVTSPNPEVKQAEEIVEEVKQEVDKRDDLILEELRKLNSNFESHNEHFIRHLENHTVTAQAPVQEVASEATEPVKESLPEEPVSLSIEEPKDMPKEEEKKRRRKFGKRR